MQISVRLSQRVSRLTGTDHGRTRRKIAQHKHHHHHPTNNNNNKRTFLIDCYKPPRAKRNFLSLVAR